MNSPQTRLSMHFIFLLLLLVSPSHAAASIFEGTAVKITDGDTITVLDSDKVQHRVRGAGSEGKEGGAMAKYKPAAAVGVQGCPRGGLVGIGRSGFPTG